MNKNRLSVIFAILLAGMLFLTACVEPDNNVENPSSGTITGTISLANVPEPEQRPQGYKVFISVWGTSEKNKWESELSQIDLDSGNNYRNIPWSIPLYEKDGFFPSYGKFILHVQEDVLKANVGNSDETDKGNNVKKFLIPIESISPYFNSADANVGYLGEFSIKPITFSGTIDVKYRNNSVPFVEIGVDTSSKSWISYTRLGKPAEPAKDGQPAKPEEPVASNAQWSIELPPFSVPTNFSLRIVGFNSNGSRLFTEIRGFDIRALASDEKELNINLGNITNTPAGVKPLNADVWVDGEITMPLSVDWYSFNAVAGTKYYIWWNDRADGDNDINKRKTLDIDVYAYDSLEDIIQLTNGITENENDNAWGAPVSFTAVSSGTVYVRVRALNGAASVGTYAILYTANSAGVPTRLSAGVWANANVTSFSSIPNKMMCYYFNVVKDTTYYLWWNDNGAIQGVPQGNGSKTLDIKVDAHYNFSGGESIFVEQDSAWTTPMSFKPDSDGVVFLKVRPFFSNANSGTFGIVFNTSGVRPNP